MSRWGGAEEKEIDRRNQHRTFNLASKVSQLKSVAVDLETETYEHNRLLDGINSDFGSGDSLLMGSMNRLRGVLGAGQSNRKAMCYTIGAVVVFFITIIYLVSRTSTSS